MRNLLNKLNNPDFKHKIIKINNTNINILFIETLIDTKNLNEFILKYLNVIKIKNKSILKYINDIPNFNIDKIKYTDVIDKLFNGFVILNINKNYYSLEIKKSLDSGIKEIENEKTIKGPKDAFTENYQTNIGLIRKRIRSDKLKIIEKTIGKRSKTKVGILYISDICKKENIDKIINKMNNIDIDILLDTNYIYEYINNNNSLFKTSIITERPDMVSYKLLDGKIALVVENSPTVIIIPVFFSEFFHSMEDYYINTKNATYLRFIRMIAFFITTMLPGIYIALITYNHEIIPPDLLINFSIQKDGVPFSTITEALITNLIFEVLRETDARTPNFLGSALSIVGALVLGDAAVNAGLVSPIMIIVIAITAISELIFTVNELANACKLYRLLFMIFACLSGIIGVFISFIILIVDLSSLNSLDYPFIYPASPFNLKDNFNNLVITLKYKMTYRNKLTTKNNIRGKI